MVCCGDQRFPGLRSETDRGVLHPHLVPLPGTEGCHPEAVRRIVSIAAPPRSSGHRPLTVRQELNRDPPEAVPEDRLNRGPPELRVQAVDGSAGSRAVAEQGSRNLLPGSTARGQEPDA